MPDQAAEPNDTSLSQRIMLVEDEFLIRLTLSEVLADEGYEVIEAATGDDALQLLQDGADIRVLLTDIQLPGVLDGHALVEQARLLLPNLPVIFMTGRPDAAAARPGRIDEAVVAKPYLPSDICRAIKAMLERTG